MTGSVLPQSGRCQSGRWWSGGGRNHDIGAHPCPARAAPGSVYCKPHLAEALARLPDRRIGDRAIAALHWGSYGTFLSRGGE